jgi:alpha-tubulin suppressor-like RCC1 family protein
MCALKSDDTLHCSGRNNAGQVGDGTSGTNRLVLTAVTGSGTWKQVAAGAQHTCAIESDDSLHCWGNNGDGWLGDNSTTNRLVPTQINGGGLWKQVAAGSAHSCGIKIDDSLHCWGANTQGQLGDNSTTVRFLPTAVSGGGSWRQVAVGSGHSCGIKFDDTLYCWGSNTSGRTGLNTSTGGTLVPTGISGGGTWKQVATGQDHTCAIKSDDTLHCWGFNGSGRTGLNTAAGNTLVPTQIDGGGSWKQVAGGSIHTCAIKSDDSLHCWGNNGNGRLGDNSQTNRLVPTAINGGGLWKQVAAGGNHTCAIQADDTLRCWGANGNGQLGDNSVTQRLVPTGISGGGPWKQVVASGGTTCGIESDDTMHCWGFNAFGQVGDDGTTLRLEPTAISGGGTWHSAAAGSTANHSCAITITNNLYCWGSNNGGQLTATEYSAPFRMTGVQTWCGEPARKAGALVYNSTSNVMQYCDGVGWVQVGK